MTQDSFTLDEGQVVLQYPLNLSSASVEYMETWLQLQMRVAKVRAAKLAALNEALGHDKGGKEQSDG